MRQLVEGEICEIRAAIDRRKLSDSFLSDRSFLVEESGFHILVPTSGTYEDEYRSLSIRLIIGSFNRIGNLDLEPDKISSKHCTQSPEWKNSGSPTPWKAGINNSVKCPRKTLYVKPHSRRKRLSQLRWKAKTRKFAKLAADFLIIIIENKTHLFQKLRATFAQVNRTIGPGSSPYPSRLPSQCPIANP